MLSSKEQAIDTASAAVCFMLGSCAVSLVSLHHSLYLILPSLGTPNMLSTVSSGNKSVGVQELASGDSVI